MEPATFSHPLATLWPTLAGFFQPRTGPQTVHCAPLSFFSCLSPRSQREHAFPTNTCTHRVCTNYFSSSLSLSRSLHLYLFVVSLLSPSCPPILSTVEASRLFILRIFVLSLSISLAFPFGFYCGEFSPHLRWQGFPEIAITSGATTRCCCCCNSALRVIYFYYHASRAALLFLIIAVALLWSCYALLRLLTTGAVPSNPDASMERRLSNERVQNQGFSVFSLRACEISIEPRNLSSRQRMEKLALEVGNFTPDKGDNYFHFVLPSERSV